VCWHSWFGFHHAGYPDLVRSSAKATVYTAQLVIRACLDHTVSTNGDIGFLGLAHWPGESPDPKSPDSLPGTTHS